MEEAFEKAATRIAWATGRPLTFLICCLTVIVWAVTGPVFHFSDTWQLVINTGTTIVTFLMVFLIQNSQNREGEALQAKLDEIIRALETAENRFIGLERRTEKEIDEMRTECEAEAPTASALRAPVSPAASNQVATAA
jgi:low affinity Fe/Cu permease